MELGIGVLPKLSGMFKGFDLCLPTKTTTVQSGPDGLHEVKYDGFRCRGQVRLRPAWRRHSVGLADRRAGLARVINPALQRPFFLATDGPTVHPNTRGRSPLRTYRSFRNDAFVSCELWLTRSAFAGPTSLLLPFPVLSPAPYVRSIARRSATEGPNPAASVAQHR